MLAERVNPGLRRVPPWAVYAAGAVPLLVLVVQTVTGGLGADPVKVIERSLGLYGLQFFIATLCVSPLRWMTGISLLRFRRAVGVLTFVYVSLHLAVWVVLDLQFRWTEIGADLTRRPYIVIGFAAFLLMLPLAVTSNNLSVRRLGAAAWQRLHWLTYPAVLLGAIHFLWQAKTWQPEPLTYLGVVLALLVVRAGRSLQRRLA
ncbi:MAG: protein-methionine-sulfoxide reductase heme-binding subunit MsrQ [Gemmobacter sp.]